jgi:hypothetical protein
MLSHNMTLDAVDPPEPAQSSNMNAMLRALEKSIEDHFSVWPTDSTRAYEELQLHDAASGAITRVYHIIYGYCASGHATKKSVEDLCNALRDDIFKKYPSGGVLVWRRRPVMDEVDRAEQDRLEAKQDNLPLPPENWAHKVTLRIGVVAEPTLKRGDSQLDEGDQLRVLPFLRV